MAGSANGMPSIATVQNELDVLGTWFKSIQAASAINVAAIAARTKIMGDGTTTNPGIDNAFLQAQQQRDLDALVNSSVLGIWTSMGLRNILSAIESQVTKNLPSWLDGIGLLSCWNFAGGGLHVLDAYLTRLNGGGPATPTGTPSLAAATGGAQPEVVAGQAPRVKYAFVGAYDYLESFPSAASSQVAIAVPNCAYDVTGIDNPIPTGVRKIRLYRQLYANAGAGDPYYWDKDVPCVAGQAPPAVKLTAPDASLRMDIPPASWLALMLLPVEAAMFMLTWASQPTGGAAGGLPSVASSMMISPSNVTLGPVSGYLGIATPAALGTFGTWIATTYTAGSIRTTNDPAQVVQGFAGAAGGVQARVTATLNGTASLTNVLYTYLDSTHPTTPQSGTIAGPLSLSAASGSTVDLAIPAGRLVLTITGVTVGTATTGTFIFEGKDLRSI